MNETFGSRCLDAVLTAVRSRRPGLAGIAAEEFGELTAGHAKDADLIRVRDNMVRQWSPTRPDGGKP